MQPAPTSIVPRGSTDVVFAPRPPKATVAIVSRTTFVLILICLFVWCRVVLFILFWFVLFCFVLFCFVLGQIFVFILICLFVWSCLTVFLLLLLLFSCVSFFLFYRLPYGTHLTFYIWPSSTLHTDCPAGRYGYGSGKTSVSQCAYCPVGRYGGRQGITSHLQCTICPGGRC